MTKEQEAVEAAKRFVADAPVSIGFFDMKLPEVMYYLYLPVEMGDTEHPDIRLPPNVECCLPLIVRAMERAPRAYQYAYLSARKGWATPDNPLNRPGWHCDGYGTDDMNYVWWSGPGTRFAVHDFHDISPDHVESLAQFAAQVRADQVFSPPHGNLYALTPSVVHATPVIGAPGCMREYVKVSLSDSRYNLENNSHNYLFDYHWPLHSRDMIRNDPHKAQVDFL